MKKITTTFLAILVLFVSFSALEAASPRKVLVEEFSATWCGPCGAYAPYFYNGIKDLVDQDKVIPVIYYTDLPSWVANDAMIDQKRGVYGITGIPSAVVQGKTAASVSNPAPTITPFLNQTSPITMLVTDEKMGSKVTVNVVVQTDEAITGGDKYLFVVPCHEKLEFSQAPGSNGQKEFHWQAITILTDQQPLDIKAGESKTFTYQFDWNNQWEAGNVYAVAYIQTLSQTSLEVLQCAKTDNSGPKEPELTIEQSMLDFQKVAQKKEMTVNVKNTGLASFKIKEIKFEGTGAEAYSIIDGYDADVPAMGETELTVVFRPKDNIAYNADLKVVTDFGKVGTVKLKGQGYGVTDFPEIQLMEDFIDFGTVKQDTDHSFKFKNLGTGDLNITNIQLIDNYKNGYEIKNTEDIVVPSGETGEIVISLIPPKSDTYYATLQFNTNDESMPNVSVDISGEATNIDTYAMCVPNMLELNFGDVDHSSRKTIELENKGWAFLNITDISISGDADGVYSIDGETTASELENGDKHTFDVIFKPVKDGQVNAKLVITSNSKDSETMEIDLMGVGVDFGNVNESAEKEGVQLLPNPANISTGSELLFNESKTNIKVEVYDMNGSLVQNAYTGNVTAGQKVQINTNAFAAGRYLVKVIDNGNIINSILIVE